MGKRTDPAFIEQVARTINAADNEWSWRAWNDERMGWNDLPEEWRRRFRTIASRLIRRYNMTPHPTRQGRG